MIEILNKNWHILQVATGKENFVENYLIRLKLKDSKPFLPKVKLKIRKQTTLMDVIKPLYPGYLFLLTDDWNSEEANKIIKTPNVIKILGGINSPKRLLNKEINMIYNVVEYGIAGYSKVINVGTKIKIISGPLKNLEGNIISVDRRKQRVRVNLPLLDSFVKVSLSFDYIE